MLLKICLLLLWTQTSFAAVKLDLPKAFALKFTQKVKSQLSGKVRENDGALTYTYPKKIRLDFQDQLVISNGKKTWFYTKPFQVGEEGNLEVREQSAKEGDPLSFIFDTLYEGKSPDKETTYTQVGKKIIMNFTGSSVAKYGLQNVELLFAKPELQFQGLESLKLIKSDGQLVEITFSRPEILTKVDEKIFVFEKPTAKKAKK